MSIACTVLAAASGVQTTLPVLSALTQNVLDLQETEVSQLVPSMLTGPVQVVPLYPKRSPVSSTAAQKLALGHDTEVRKWPEPMTSARG